MQKRKLTAFISAFLSAAVLAGCSSTENSKGTAPDNTPLFDNTVDVSIGYWNIDHIKDSQSDPMLDMIQNRFGINIQPVSVDWSSYKDYYQMLCATNSLPDVFVTLTISSNDSNDSAFLEQLISSGSIRPLPSDLSAYPHLEKLMEQHEYTRYSDGNFYAIPRCSFNDPILSSTDAAMLVRKDWMEQLGYDNPSSLEEFTDMITAFAKEDPDGNGIDDTIGYNVNILSALGKWVILGIAPDCNVYSWIQKDGRYIPSWYSSEFTDVVKAYRTMYQNGGLDPDFYIKNPNEVLEDFAEGRLGCLEFKSSPSAIREVKMLWEQYNYESFEDCVDVLHIFPAPDGKTYCNTSSSFWSESFISSSVSDEKLEHILALYEYLLSDDGIFMSKYGLKDQDYTIESNGEYTCLLDTDEDSLINQLEKEYPSIILLANLASWGGTMADFELNDLNYSRYGKTCVELANKDLNWNIDNTIPVERDEEFQMFPKEASEIFSTAYAFNEFVQCIIGSGDPEAMWENTISSLQSLGIDSYIDAQNKAFISSK